MSEDHKLKRTSHGIAEFHLKKVSMVDQPKRYLNSEEQVVPQGKLEGCTVLLSSDVTLTIQPTTSSGGTLIGWSWRLGGLAGRPKSVNLAMTT